MPQYRGFISQDSDGHSVVSSLSSDGVLKVDFVSNIQASGNSAAMT